MEIEKIRTLKVSGELSRMDQHFRGNAAMSQACSPWNIAVDHCTGECVEDAEALEREGETPKLVLTIGIGASQVEHQLRLVVPGMEFVRITAWAPVLLRVTRFDSVVTAEEVASAPVLAS